MQYAGAVVDLDGTVYRGDALVPGAARGLAALRDAGVRTLFVSNNPTRSPSSFASHLGTLGLDVVAEDVLTSGVVARDYLRREHPDARVFVLGEAGLREQLDGVETTRNPDEADVLLASIDRNLEYDHLVAALRALAAGAALVGTDPDGTIPAADGVLPGSGAVLGAIRGMTGRDPDAVAGKPSAQMAEAALDRLGVDASACLVVGDRLDTDVELGARAGMTTVLVCTGVTDRADVGRSAVAPDYVVDSLADVASVLSDREP